ncbi:MAG: hypothetical protein KUG78_17300 [Kangiellaceae bacterium]|nr:hypothetical protein [Kangiellaceae bacterium]
MKSKEMSDDEKEVFMRKNSLTMLIATLKFAGKFISIFIVLYILLFVLDNLEPELATSVSESFYSVNIMITLTVVTLLYVWIRNVIRRKL